MSFYKRISRKIYNVFHPALGTILMLHRVVATRSLLDANRDIEITPDFLENVILQYKKAGYEFVSLDDAFECLSRKKKLKSQFICITFDDGYRDNYEIAYPILKKHACPFTIYVTTDFGEHKAFLWWYVLEDILMKHDNICLTDGNVYPTKTKEEKNTAFNSIHKTLRPLPPPVLKTRFGELFANYDFSFTDTVKELSLSKEQLKLLADEKLCMIGSHTVTHPALDNLSKAEQEDEMKHSKEQLEAMTGTIVRHFAYPFGLFNADSMKTVEKFGYKTAVMAWGGKTRKGDNPFCLKREILKQ